MSAMSKIYADQIRRGKKTIDDVPSQLRDEVIAILIEWGIWDGDAGNE